ncbi:hypothetical protein [Brenneria tiliae]|nr:hypothetical protein [Brenneria tiliae]
MQQKLTRAWATVHVLEAAVRTAAATSAMTATAARRRKQATA